MASANISSSKRWCWISTANPRRCKGRRQGAATGILLAPQAADRRFLRLRQPQRNQGGRRTLRGISDDRGLLICDVNAPASGNIILQAETGDADGNASVANREIWVAGNDDWWFDASDNDASICCPRKTLRAGDTARFQLRMPFKEAEVLVTVEREGVMESFVTHLTRANPIIAVPIKGNIRPTYSFPRWRYAAGSTRRNRPR